MVKILTGFLWAILIDPLMDTMSQPSAAKALAVSITPVLSYTEISALIVVSPSGQGTF